MKKMKSDLFLRQVSFSLIFLFLFTFLSKSTNAYIGSPYVVYEPTQVIFGDSSEIITSDHTYLGLENYQYDYVSGYLHISYTYTHHVCCYASYPPNIYITNFDPRSTTTPIIKLPDTTHPLIPGNLTDWYLYNIQFDSTGYTINIKEAGDTEIYNEHITVSSLDSHDWAGLANSYPDLGGNYLLNSMSYTPRPIMENPNNPPPSEIIPVIIVPGIMGSYLNKEDGTEVWMNIPKMVLPGNDSYLDDLQLSVNGESNLPLQASEMINTIGNTDLFENLINTLNLNFKVFDFAYDWRVSNLLTAQKLKEKIDQVKIEIGSNKVNIIAHSMGGLVVKSYIKNYNDGSINKFIELGTPHLGSPKSYKILQYGDSLNASLFFGLIGLNRDRIKIISQNMPSVYELLPSKKYFETTNISYISDLDDIDGNSIRGNLNFEQTKDLLKNTGRNGTLVDKADLFHQTIDNLNPADYGVKTYNIVGCGTPTIGKIFILNKENNANYEYEISYTNGDGTVPIKSAEGVPAQEVYYLNNANHGLMPSALGIKELINSFLLGTSTNTDTFSNLSKSSSICSPVNGQVISFHSPIELNVYDSQNHHTGPTPNGDIEYNIPGVDYEIIDGNKFAFLPNGQSYKIIGKSTATGKFNARIEKISNENILETKYFNEIPLSTTTQIKTDINSNTGNILYVDGNGDGIFEGQVQASATLNQSQSADFIKPTTQILVEGKKKDKLEPFSKPVTISFNASDDNSGILKTEYSLNGGISWLKYTTPFIINNKGENSILYRSIDRAGNLENSKVILITINKQDKK